MDYYGEMTYNFINSKIVIFETMKYLVIEHKHKKYSNKSDWSVLESCVEMIQKEAKRQNKTELLEPLYFAGLVYDY